MLISYKRGEVKEKYQEPIEQGVGMHCRLFFNLLTTPKISVQLLRLQLLYAPRVIQKDQNQPRNDLRAYKYNSELLDENKSKEICCESCTSVLFHFE